MDNLENKVLFLTRCMLLFQIMDYVFKLHVVLFLDPNFYNFNPTPKMNTIFFLTIVVFHHLQLCNNYLVLSQDLSHWVKLRNTPHGFFNFY
jgi:hypothetical protein